MWVSIGAIFDNYGSAFGIPEKCESSINKSIVSHMCVLFRFFWVHFWLPGDPWNGLGDPGWSLVRRDPKNVEFWCLWDPAGVPVGSRWVPFSGSGLPRDPSGPPLKAIC